MLFNDFQEHFLYITSELFLYANSGQYPSTNNMKSSLILLARKWACKFDNFACRTSAAAHLTYYQRIKKLSE